MEYCGLQTLEAVTKVHQKGNSGNDVPSLVLRHPAAAGRSLKGGIETGGYFIQSLFIMLQTRGNQPQNACFLLLTLCFSLWKFGLND